MAKQTWTGTDRVKPVLLEKIPSNTDEFYAHKIATTGEHGVVGTLVGTADVQTLTNKTIDAQVNTVTGMRHGIEVDDTATGVHGITGQVVGTTDVQTLTNKTILITEPVLPEEPATKNYVDQTAFNVVLPNMVGNADTFLYTNGTTASWAKIPKSTGSAVLAFNNFI